MILYLACPGQNQRTKILLSAFSSLPPFPPQLASKVRRPSRIEQRRSLGMFGPHSGDRLWRVQQSRVRRQRYQFGEQPAPHNRILLPRPLGKADFSPAQGCPTAANQLAAVEINRGVVAESDADCFLFSAIPRSNFNPAGRVKADELCRAVTRQMFASPHHRFGTRQLIGRERGERAPRRLPLHRVRPLCRGLAVLFDQPDNVVLPQRQRAQRFAGIIVPVVSADQRRAV